MTAAPNNNMGEGVNKSPSTPLEWAEYYLSIGISVIPLRPRDKRPLIEWRPYQERHPTKEKLRKWFLTGKANIGIVTGRVSGNLVVLDFDNPEVFDNFIIRLDERGSTKLKQAIGSTWIVETGKGYHIYLRLEDPGLLPRTKVRLVEGVDIKGEGGYVVAPPSIHPSGKQYRFYKPSSGRLRGPPDIPGPEIIWRDEWSELLNLLGYRGEAVEGLPVEPGTQSRREDGLRELEDIKLIELKELLKKAWRKGRRQFLALYLSGWMAKAGVHPVSVAKLFTMIAKERGEDGTPLDNELADRLSTIYYTYRKYYGETRELAELDQYVEELKEQGVITRNPSRGLDADREIKGKTGVQEILEEAIDPEKATEVIRRISEILGKASPYRDSITMLTDFDKKRGYTNDMRRLRIYRCRLEGDDPESLRLRVDKLVWEGAVTKVVLYENPLGGIAKYEIIWEAKTRTKPLIIGPAYIEDIVDRLKAEGFLINHRYGRDALASIIQAFIKQGRAEVKAGIDSPGFYIVDGKLGGVKYEVKPVDIEELREALLLLNELAEKWFAHVKDRFATAVKWGVVAPFIYARKQLGRQYQVPHLALYGARNTGKTTLAEIVSIHLWGLDKARHSYAGTQVNTEARLGDKVSKSTFPIVVNEANSVFERPEVINMLKNSVEELIARGKFAKAGYVDIPALSPIILTLNPAPRVDFEELGLVPKTIILAYFTEGERLPWEKIKEFRKEVEPRLPRLAPLGLYVAGKVLERGPEYLKKNWLELGRELLEEAYREAGLEPPVWLALEYETKSFEDIDRERVEHIRNKLVRYINDQYARNISRIVEYRDGGYQALEETMENKLIALLRHNIIPFMILKGHKVYITPGVLSELGLELESLKSLAELLEWEYIPRRTIRIGSKKRTTTAVIMVDIDELVRFLSPEIMD